MKTFFTLLSTFAPETRFLARFLTGAFLLLGSLTVLHAKPELERQAFYFTQALANYEHNWRRLESLNGELWPTFAVRRPADYLFAQTAVEVFLHENPQFRTDYAKNQIFPMNRLGEIVAMIRRMQELSPESPFCGNFYWYWRQHTVEDRNAVDFVVQRLLYCWAHHDVLPEEIHPRIFEILRDAAPEVLRRRISPEYTNIAVLNFSNLILLGETLNDPKLTEEGIDRLNRFLFWTWKNGIHEFGSTTYYAVVLEGLEELLLLTKNDAVRQKAEALIQFWALEMRLHFTENGRLAGACSRTYNFLYGDELLANHVGTWGWCALPPDRSNILILAALALSTERVESLVNEGRNAIGPDLNFPFTVQEKWGDHWKTTFQTAYFSVGTSTAQYGSHQDQLWTVDWTPNSPADPNARCFLAADGRDDPWGLKREETGGGHQKAFHLDPQWQAFQSEAETHCRAFYPAEMIRKFREENPGGAIRSTFVLKRPDEFRFLAPTRLAARYGRNWLVLTLFTARNAQVAEKFIDSPDGNAVAWCVTHDLEAGAKTGAELVFTSQIVPDLENLHPVGDWKPPQMPEGILTLNGQEVGRRLLERLVPSLREYADSQAALIRLTPGKPCVVPAQEARFWRDFAAGDAVRVQAPTEFRFLVTQPGKYQLSARVLALDPNHDSLKVTYKTNAGTANEAETRIPCWALGSSSDWRTVNLPPPLDLPAGIVHLTLEPREFNVQVKELILKKR